jgi:multisubunit Na+/H+ antiporter MnhF subunit
MFEEILESLRANSQVSTALTVALVVYLAALAPQLPPVLANMFESSLFKMLVLLALVALLYKENYVLAVIMAVAFLLSMNTVSRYRINALSQELTGMPSSKEYSTDVELGPGNIARWSNNGDTSSIQIRGHTYSHNVDEVDQL